MQVTPVVAGCIVRNRKILLSRKSTSHSPEIIGKWEMPGGKVEDGEAPREALTREVQEELGLLVYVKELLHAQINTYSEGTRYLVLFYKCDLLSGFPGQVGSELQWITATDPLWGNTLPGAKEALRELLMRGGF